MSWGGVPKGSGPTWEPAFVHTLMGGAKVTARAACGAAGDPGGTLGAKRGSCPFPCQLIQLHPRSSSSIPTGASTVCGEPVCQRSLDKYLPRLLK